MLETALDAGVSPETLRKIESGRVATPAFPAIAAIDFERDCCPALVPVYQQRFPVTPQLP